MLFADVAELADALDLGSSVTDVGVQVPSSAPLRVFLQNLNGFVRTFVFYLSCTRRIVNVYTLSCVYIYIIFR